MHNKERKYSVGSIASRATCKRIIIGNNWCTSKVESGSHDVIISTGTSVVCTSVRLEKCSVVIAAVICHDYWSKTAARLLHAVCPAFAASVSVDSHALSPKHNDEFVFLV